MSKLKEVFKSEKTVLSEISRLEDVFVKSGSVIASYAMEFTDKIVSLFVDKGFYFQEKDVAGKTYSVVSKSVD